MSKIHLEGLYMEIHIHDHYTLEGDNEVSFDEVTKNSIKDWLKSLIQAFIDDEENFVLDDLKHIYVAKDYVGELYAFQEEKGLEQGHTKNEISEGQAMVINYKNEEGLEEASIFFRAEFILGLYTSSNFGEEFKDEIAMLYNTFFHELCHINDDYQTREIITNEDINKCSIIPRNLYPISFHMWKEYYAYRKSAIRYPYGDLQINHLRESLDWILDEVSKLKEKFKKDDDMNSFMYEFTIKTRYLLRVFVSVIGNIQGYSRDNKEVEEKAFKIVLDLFPEELFANLFDRLIVELNNLFDKYPKWSGLNELDGLNELVLECFNNLGVFPTEIDKDDQMYIGIKDKVNGR